MSDALFEALGDGRFAPTALTRGPWDPGAQHGGAPAALLGREIERVEGDLRVARVTLELLRPVPLTELRAETEVVRPGRRVQLVEARLHAGDTLVVRALALRIRRARGTTETIGAGAPADGPEHGTATHLEHEGDRPSFASTANEIRFVRGSYAPGPAFAWIRLACDVVAGERPSGVQRVLAAGDFGNGVSSVLDWGEHRFINPDLSVHLARDPEGEWIGLDAASVITDDGTGQAQSVLHDARGPVGRAVQALFVDRR